MAWQWMHVRSLAVIVGGLAVLVGGLAAERVVAAGVWSVGGGAEYGHCGEGEMGERKSWVSEGKT